MTATAADSLRSGDIICRHPSGAIAQAYHSEGRLWTAMHLPAGMVVRHPDGGWGTHDYEKGYIRRLSRPELAQLAEIRPGPEHPPLLPVQAGLFDDQPDIEPPLPTFRRWTMAELLAEPDDFAWLIKGLLAEPTYGQIAGEMKSLKTYVAAMIQVGLASGAPIFDRFIPARPRPVLAYVGEGGRRPYVRRLRRVAQAIGVDLAAIPLEIVSEAAPITSDIFACSVARDLAEMEPGLVTIDPLYAYQGAKVSSSQLNEMGTLLTGLSNRCLDAGANLIIVNHMNQTGTGMDLKRITGSGGGEWVDSWMLLKHREAADVEAGQFKLRMEIGSRQWGGTSWDLDLDIGHFNEEHGSHDGPISWTLQRAQTNTEQNTEKTSRKIDKARTAILETLADRPLLSKTDLYALIGGNRDDFHQALNGLIESGRITHDKHGTTPAGAVPKRAKWQLLEHLTPEPGPEGAQR